MHCDGPFGFWHTKTKHLSAKEICRFELVFLLQKIEGDFGKNEEYIEDRQTDVISVTRHIYTSHQALDLSIGDFRSVEK